ncbi:hypothetical protein LQZ18_16875 [Lachnospiraceae bacterium ZAX-1]
MSRLTQTIAGITYNTPFVIGSSPLTDSPDLIKQAEENGAGAVSTKLTMLIQPIQGVRKMYGVKGMYQFNPSDKRNDFEDGLELVRKAREATDLVIWANMAGPGEDLDGWVKLGKALEQAGAHALELNFNCPNFNQAPDAGKKIKVGAGVGKNPELCEQVSAAVKNAVKIPVIPKISPDVPDVLQVYSAIERAKVDGVVINTGYLAAPPIDIYRHGAINMGTMTKCAMGAAVGPINKQYSNRFVALCAQNNKIPIAGGGGIASWEDAVESIMFGSSLTTVCTKLLWEGYPYLKKMVAGLEKFMEEQGYESIDQMRGIALENLVTTDAMEYTKNKAKVDKDKCVGCGACEKIGSCRAIKLVDKKAVVDENICISCGLCGALCNKKAISF